MKKIVLIALAIATTQMSYGWGKNGLTIVSELAEQYLTQKTRDDIKSILGDESMADAAQWLDQDENKELQKNQDHWSYAYKDVTLEANALIILPQAVEVLQDPESDQEEKQLALRTFIHVIADIHNPLHCGYYKDAGGHKPKLTWEGSEEKTNLHKAWDSDMILRYNSDVKAYRDELQERLTKEEQEKWATTDYAVIVKESQEMVDQAYDFDGKVLTNEYYEQNIILVNDRLSMAAYRLAYILNSVFDPA